MKECHQPANLLKKVGGPAPRGGPQGAAAHRFPETVAGVVHCDCGAPGCQNEIVFAAPPAAEAAGGFVQVGVRKQGEAIVLTLAPRQLNHLLAQARQLAAGRERQTSRRPPSGQVVSAWLVSVAIPAAATVCTWAGSPGTMMRRNCSRKGAVYSCTCTRRACAGW